MDSAPERRIPRVRNDTINGPRGPMAHVGKYGSLISINIFKMGFLDCSYGLLNMLNMMIFDVERYSTIETPVLSTCFIVFRTVHITMVDFSLP